MAKIILGLDPGIADTGYGVISCEKGKLTCLTYGSIKTSPKQNLLERLEELDSQLKTIINKYQPELIAVEQLFFNKNVKTALIVGQARGIILLRIKKSGAKFFEFTPGQIKQAVTAYGKASKNQVQKMVKIILSLKELPQPDDAADALAIAICSSNLK